MSSRCGELTGLCLVPLCARSVRFEEWSLKSIEKELVPKALMKGFGAQIETSRANPVEKDEQVEPKTSAGPGASKGGYAVAKPEKVSQGMLDC